MHAVRQVRMFPSHYFVSCNCGFHISFHIVFLFLSLIYQGFGHFLTLSLCSFGLSLHIACFPTFDFFFVRMNYRAVKNILQQANTFLTKLRHNQIYKMYKKYMNYLIPYKTNITLSKTLASIFIFCFCVLFVRFPLMPLNSVKWNPNCCPVNMRWLKRQRKQEQKFQKNHPSTRNSVTLWQLMFKQFQKP